MPLTLANLLPDILSRVEEDLPAGNPAGAPGGPIFWDLNGEVYVQMVDAMFEAALATGTVQASSVLVTLAAETTYFPLQNAIDIGIPRGVVAALRLRAPYQIRKTSLKALDDYDPTWQQAVPSAQIVSWFPLGTSYFGIYPQLSEEAQCTMDFIVSPVNQARPYDGSQSVPLQQEFADLLSQYAAGMLRSKEGGSEAEEADVVTNAYMSRLKALSLFQNRIDSLDYSLAFGAQSRPNPRNIV